MRFGPVAFLFAVVIGWAGLRTAMLWPDAPAQLPPATIAWQPQLPAKGEIDAPQAWIATARANRKRDPARAADVVRLAAATPPTQRLLRSTTPALIPSLPAAESSTASQPPGLARTVRAGAFSLSSWSILRGDGRAGLAAGGQLGGSQAGLRARYGLNSSLALAARLSGPLRSSLGKEAAIALDWQPALPVPVILSVERRIGLDRGGRDAFAVGVSGGFAAELPLEFTLDGYGQAGVVGLVRRDVYADGAVRVERTIVAANRIRLGVGAGVWAGAQPEVSRVDVGPQLVAHVPLARGGLRIGTEWRQRVAGNALPGSGPTITLGADF